MFYGASFVDNIMAAQLVGKDKIDSALFLMLANAGILGDQMDMLGDFGVTSIAMFSHIASDAED